MKTQRARTTKRATATKPDGGRSARSAKAALRREQLLSTALDLFCEHGYAATSTKRIADAAGVTEGLIFHYFATKEALLLELATKQTTFAGRVLALVQGAEAGTARDLLFAMAAGFAEISEREAAFVAFMNAEAAVNPALRGPITVGTEAVLRALVARLRARVATGELREEASLTSAMLGFFGGFSFFFGQHRDLPRAAFQRESAAFAHAWADQCWRGLATPLALSTHSADGKTRGTP